jgi:stage III sporulation protein SpoIIIAA
MLAFDEIGSLKELHAIKECFNAGVRVVTTFHTDGIEELLLRNRNLPILDTEAFKNIVMLNKDYKPTIYKKENLIAKNTGGYIDSHTVCFGGNI